MTLCLSAQRNIDFITILVGIKCPVKFFFFVTCLLHAGSEKEVTELLSAKEFRTVTKRSLINAGYYLKKEIAAEIHPYVDGGEEDYQVTFRASEVGYVDFILSEAICVGTWYLESNVHLMGIYKWESWAFVIDLTGRKVTKVYGNKK
jgi:hypothetical protein